MDLCLSASVCGGPGVCRVAELESRSLVLAPCADAVLEPSASV